MKSVRKRQKKKKKKTSSTVTVFKKEFQPESQTPNMETRSSCLNMQKKKKKIQRNGSRCSRQMSQKFKFLSVSKDSLLHMCTAGSFSGKCSGKFWTDQLSHCINSLLINMFLPLGAAQRVIIVNICLRHICARCIGTE